MAVEYSLTEARARFEELVGRAAAGETIILTKRNRPVLKIVPFTSPNRKAGTGMSGESSGDFEESPAGFAK